MIIDLEIRIDPGAWCPLPFVHKDDMILKDPWGEQNNDRIPGLKRTYNLLQRKLCIDKGGGKIKQFW